MERNIKILYVCPYTHQKAGHHAHVASVEPEILREDEAIVDILTYDDIRKDSLLDFMQHYSVARYTNMVLETRKVIKEAIKRSSDYDIIYLRDAEPFPFVVHTELALNKTSPLWLLNYTGATLFPPNGISLYTLALSFMNSSMWDKVYNKAHNLNSIIYTVENDRVKNELSNHVPLKSRIESIPYWVRMPDKIMDKKDARNKLGISQDALVLLSFGASHPGKNLDIVFQTIKDIPDTVLVYAGNCSKSIGEKPNEIAERYGVTNAIIHDRWIEEGEKPLFFGASDAMVLSYTENFKSTSSLLFESASYGLPIIASDSDYLEKTLKDYNMGLIFKASNQENLTSAIKIFKQSDKIKESECKRFCQDHSSGAWAKKLLSLYSI